MKHQSALVVFSGGQDSTTCLFWAMQHYETVEAVTFAYGQRHHLEIQITREIAKEQGIRHHILDMSLLGQITAQPDFATIYISYIPDKLCVESKSLKLYLFSYRNHGDFHENCINTIGKDLVNLLDPRYLEVWGKFTPRGGISIDPYYNYGKPGTKYEGLAEQRLFQHDLYPEKIDNR
ncbi:7-cyano-7-deazaguanine reductase [Streptococcus pneumoniae]|uniref:preQ(1) synthase n=1 Tax=Streptococcus pneumoniae TaxID=1313 RepID=UPI0005E69851|nr:preQ(1) synthase [Streptococcus pneumoniae]CEW95745.1 7-cyano-7-deazaguanine reductase [Streptococcus pneumoniae]VJK44646.1 7-cyano-7-deazaguanine reductase [Streptococcus pneumoniae]VOJ83866.1 7-cyano-7-deazaguanine reductase [Streptococcus pneumoniae]